MALSNIEITESLFQSVEVIVDQKMKTIECDITDLCVIVDDSNAKNGIYWVSTNNGATKYKAISESSEYKKNEKVRVSIPKGDYSGDKYIIFMPPSPRPSAKPPWNWVPRVPCWTSAAARAITPPSWQRP